MSILGAAISTLIAFTIASVITVCISFKLLKSIVSSVIMSLIIWKLNPIGTLNVLISIRVGAVVYFMIGFVEWDQEGRGLGYPDVHENFRFSSLL